MEEKKQITEDVHKQQHQKVNLEDAAKIIQQFGGFDALKSIIPAASNMNPAKQATKNIFLTENRNAAKRRQLAEEINAWLEILNENKSTIPEYVALCKKKVESNQKLLSENVTIALEQTKVLEASYRSLHLFFLNADENKLNKLSLFNTDMSVSFGASDGDNDNLLKQIDAEFKYKYDRFTLKGSYSLLVIPGGLGLFEKDGEFDKDRLLQWAKLAHKYKVLLITDHIREDAFEDLLERTDQYKDQDKELSNVVVTGNWIVARKKESLSAKENERGDFMIPPSAAIAGLMYNEKRNMAQGAFGKEHGTLTGAKGAEIDLLMSHAEKIAANNIIPIVFSEGRVMAFENCTLYNGANKYLKEYPIVRVFEWLRKVLLNYIHDMIGPIWNTAMANKLENTIKDFLAQHQGYGKLFMESHVDKPVRDEKTGRISVNVSIKPYFAAKNFVIKLSSLEKKNSDSDEFSVE